MTPTEPREDWQAIATRAMATLDTVRAYVEPYHLAAITPTSGDVVPDDYQRGILHACDHVYQLATADPAPSPEPVTGSTSDGYHTFDELYEHRAALFALACRVLPDISWRSRHHGDGTMFPGMFIAGMHLPNGDITYHVNGDRWDDFAGVTVLDVAPEWDGHTPADVITRLNAWNPPRGEPGPDAPTTDEPYRGDHGGTAHTEIAGDVPGPWATPRVIPGTGNPLGFRTPNRAGA